MPDAELLELRRRWLVEGDPQAEGALLVALRRRGWIDDALLELAAVCGSAPAADLLTDAPEVLRAERCGTTLLLRLVDLLGERALEAHAWALLGHRQAPGPARGLEAALEDLLEAPSLEGLEALRAAHAASPPAEGAGDVLHALAWAILQDSLDRPELGTAMLCRRLLTLSEPIRRRLRAWVLSGPLGRPSLIAVRRQRSGQELHLSLVASPPFVASLERLERWLERAGVADVFRVSRHGAALELPGEGPVTADAVFAALGPHLSHRRLGFGVLFTERPDVHGWFARHRQDMAVVHVDRFVRRHLQAPRLVFAAHMLVKKALDMGLERWERWAVPGSRGRPLPFHERSSGCLFDLCREKADLDARIRAGAICAPCRSMLLEERGVSPTILTAVERVLAEGRRQVLARG